MTKLWNWRISEHTILEAKRPNMRVNLLIIYYLNGAQTYTSNQKKK